MISDGGGGEEEVEREDLRRALCGFRDLDLALDRDLDLDLDFEVSLE